MKVGILGAGHAPRALQPAFGDYPAMFETLLGGRGYDWRTYDARGGEYPAAPEACDAYLVTGSPSGVYDGDPWIAVLIDFLVAARGRAKLLGICFGHQAMAQAFGGRVIKSPKGWGVGLHSYQVAQDRPWMDPPPSFALPASHQDQVVEAPPGATVLAGSDFCPFGMLDYGGGMAISLQLHPEFEPAFAAALIESRADGPLSAAEAAQAVESLTRPNDCARVGDWIEGFLAG